MRRAGSLPNSFSREAMAVDWSRSWNTREAIERDSIHLGSTATLSPRNNCRTTTLDAPKSRKTKVANVDEPEEKLPRKEQGGHADLSPAAPPIVHEALKSPGHLLDEKTRAFFEPRFQHNFNQRQIRNTPSCFRQDSDFA